MSTPSEQPAPPKTGKWTRIAYGFAAVCLGIAAIARFSGAISSFGDQSVDANNLNDQANAALESMRSHSAAGTELAKVLTDANVDGLPGTRAGIKADAEKGADEFMAAAADARKAADLLQQASGLKVGDVYKEYLAVKSKEYRVLADIEEIEAKELKLLTDESIADGAAFRAKLDEIDKPVAALAEERKSLGEKAQKIQDDNPSVFVK